MKKRAVQFYDMGLEGYPLGVVVVANLLLGTVIVLGAIACWLVAPAFGLAYLAILAVIVYIVLRRLVCSPSDSTVPGRGGAAPVLYAT